MRYYVIKAEEADDLIYEQLKCSECVYFCETITQRGSEYQCLNTRGLVYPTPEGYCNYAAEEIDVD